ncbi:hydrolase 2, exosortase A system-associated [Denitromonas iodatirespirans]|uniref:Hydrolase 2, exosortase A system-associated n=1 Tax=Denitromonas iodatirespirans TaxID=2795389 RepID=A0A944H6W4_DENI1|nr:hydrolase 2, exosortase A system-associated [Denitromonas iodatirespirans]MBT0960579.1 hydrolase 2, exosortase A system-associated [Denitromonas iodatirespirans]
MTDILREAFFLPGDHAPGRFALLRRPAGEVRGAFLYIHPFAEEMNRSRRMMATAAEAFAHAGWAVLQIDLTGCGDSGGSSADAGWRRWLDDVSAGYAWLREHLDLTPHLWGLRAGCLLAESWLRQTDSAASALYWQPVLSGRQHLSQFLMLKAAGAMAGEGSAKTIMGPLRERLAGGEAVDIAGYTVSAELARGLEEASLENAARPHGQTVVVEAVSGERNLTPASADARARWLEAGAAVIWEVVGGSPFWLTQEITLAPAMTSRTLALIGAWDQ